MLILYTRSLGPEIKQIVVIVVFLVLVLVVCWGVVVSNLSDNLISHSDWHQTEGFTTFRYLEPPKLMVWKSDIFRGPMRFVRVPPYENGVKLTNFIFSWENGAILLSGKCCPLFHTQNEELSKKIGACICIYNRVYANTWQGGQICPPTLDRVNRSFITKYLIFKSAKFSSSSTFLNGWVFGKVPRGHFRSKMLENLPYWDIFDSTTLPISMCPKKSKHFFLLQKSRWAPQPAA